MHIRTATSLDRDHILETHLSAFPENEKVVVSKLAVHLLDEKTSPQTISLVAEINKSVIAHIAFSPVIINSNKELKGYILAPLAVKPDHQKQQIGSRLIKSGIEILFKNGVNIVFVYGDPKYYRRFGFRTDIAENFIPQYKLQYPFGWQAVILNQFSIDNSPRKIICVASLNNQKLW